MGAHEGPYSSGLSESEATKSDMIVLKRAP